MTAVVDTQISGNVTIFQIVVTPTLAHAQVWVQGSNSFRVGTHDVDVNRTGSVEVLYHPLDTGVVHADLIIQIGDSIYKTGLIGIGLPSTKSLHLPQIPHYLVQPTPVVAMSNIDQPSKATVTIRNINPLDSAQVSTTARVLNTNEWTIVGDTAKIITNLVSFDLQFLPQTTSAQDTGTLVVKVGDSTYYVKLQGVVLPWPHYTWKPTNFPIGPAITTIFLQPLTGAIFVGTKGNGIYYSNDGGCSWAARNFGLTNQYVNSIAQTPNGFLFAATDTGVYRSINDGGSWVKSDSGLAARYVKALTTVGSVLYAGTEVLGIYRSIDLGTSWTHIAAVPTAPSVALNVESFSTSAPSMMFAGTSGAGILRSIDAGNSWQLTNTPDTAVTVTSFAVPGMLYAGTSAGMLRSTDNGSTWSLANNGLGSNTNVHAITVDQTGVLLAATDAGSDSTGLVFQSYDGGTNWIQRDSGLPAIHALAISGGSLGTPQNVPGMFRPALVGTQGGGMFSAVSLNCGSPIDTLVVWIVRPVSSRSFVIAKCFIA